MGASFMRYVKANLNREARKDRKVFKSLSALSGLRGKKLYRGF
jgi:hypothetical protein